MASKTKEWCPYRHRLLKAMLGIEYCSYSFLQCNKWNLMIANFQQPTTSCLVFSSNDKEGTLRSFVGTWGRRGFCLGNITAKILAQTPIKPPSSLSLGNITAKILAQTPISLSLSRANRSLYLYGLGCFRLSFYHFKVDYWLLH